MSSKVCGLNAPGKRGNPLSLYLDFALALCAAFALTLDLNLRSGNNYMNWVASLPGTPVVSVLFAAVWYVRIKTRRVLPAAGAGTWVISLFLGLWWVLTRSIANTGEINQPFLTNGQLLKTAVITIGMASLYQLLFCALAYALTEKLEWNAECRAAGPKLRLLAKVYAEHTVLLCMGVLLLAWLPHFVIAYPCAMNGDSTAQLWQWAGVYTFSTHHPPFGTLLIGLAYQAGLVLGDGGIGLALYVALQMLAGAAVLGYLQDVLRRLGAPLWLRLLALLAACFCPVYCDNMTVIIKDVPYALGMVLMMCEIAKCVCLRERLTAAAAFRLILGGMFVMLMRNNGKYVFLPLMVFVIVWALRKLKSRASAAAALLIAWAASSLVSGVLVQAYDIVPGSIAEALSLPFQQTARFVRKHESEIPQDEYEAIDRVIGMSGLAKMYDPVISDPVKARFRDEVTGEDLKQYFAVWMKQFMRDPRCYIEATLIQNILLFDPQTRNLAIFSGTGFDEQARERLHITEPDTFNSLRTMEENLRDMLLTVPGMVQLNSLGFHCCLLLFACLWPLKRRNGNMLLLLLPMLLSMAVIVAGPCIQNQDRYGFPIIYCMPLVLACLSYEMKKTDKKEVSV